MHSDWYIDDRLRKRLGTDSSADTTGYRDYYLQHITGSIQRTTTICHAARWAAASNTRCSSTHNVLNEFYLGDILDQYKRTGLETDRRRGMRTPTPSSTKSQTSCPPATAWCSRSRSRSGKTKLPRDPPEDGEYEAPNMDRLGL